MPRDIQSSSRAVLREIQSLGYRTGVAAEPEGSPRFPRWYATAKRDSDGQFHVAKADDERTVIAELARLVGLDLLEG